jgi:hypothetical protein
VWVYVLNSKIQHGPEEAVQLTETTTAAGLIASAARLADPAGSSLTSAHDKSTDKKEKE